MSCGLGAVWSDYTQLLANRKARECASGKHLYEPPEKGNLSRTPYSQSFRPSSRLDTFCRGTSTRRESRYPLPTTMPKQEWAPTSRQEPVLLSGNGGCRAFDSSPQNVNIRRMSATVKEHQSLPSQPSIFARPNRSRRDHSYAPSLHKASAIRNYNSQPYSMKRNLLPSNGAVFHNGYDFESAVSEASISVIESLALTEVREKENMLKKLEDMQRCRRKFILGALPEPAEFVLERSIQNLIEAECKDLDTFSTELMTTNLETDNDDSSSESDSEESEYFQLINRF